MYIITDMPYRGNIFNLARARKYGLPEVRNPAKKIKAIVNKQINKKTEKKHVHLQDNLTPITNAGHFFHINKIALGAEDYQHVGNKIQCLRIGLRGIVMPSTENVVVDPYNEIRMIVLYDKQTNGALPAIGEIFTYPTDVNSPRNPDFSDRFITLADKSFLVYNKTGQNYQGSKFRINIKKKLKTEFKGNGNTIADISTGSVFVFWLSDSVLADHPFVKYDTAYTYMDF